MMTAKTLRVSLLAVLAAGMAWAAEDAGRLVFVKDNEVYIAAADGSGLKKVTDDGVRKWGPRFSPDGTRFVFRTWPAGDKAMGRFSLMDADGTPVREIVFRPPSPVLIGGMRFVEEFWWADDRRLVLYGSINPNNCDYSVLDATDGREAAGYIGACGTYAASPDNQHLAYLEGPGMGAAEEARRDLLEIDGKIVYPAGRSTIRFLTNPQWSADSTTVAILEREVDAGTGGRAVVAVSTKGAVTRIPLPGYLEEPLDLRWAGNRLILEAAGMRHAVDLAGRTLAVPGPDSDTVLEQARANEQRRNVLRQQAVSVARKLGAVREEDIDVYIPPSAP